MAQVWTPERRAAQAARMRQRWAAGEFSAPLSRGDPNKRWRWTPAELEMLAQYAGTEPLWRLTARVNQVSLWPRTPLAVRYRLYRLGLSVFCPRERSVASVAERLGRSRVRVQQWIREGRLQATRSGSGRAARGTDWLIDRQDVDAMLRADPWLIDPADIRDPSWRALVQVERRVAQRRRGRKEVAA